MNCRMDPTWQTIRKRRISTMGEPPISETAPQGVKIRIIKEIDNLVSGVTMLAQTPITVNEVLEYKAVAKEK
jgi:hypothetical protein